jgi:hypothetical protein
MSKNWRMRAEMSKNNYLIWMKSKTEWEQKYERMKNKSLIKMKNMTEGWNTEDWDTSDWVYTEGWKIEQTPIWDQTLHQNWTMKLRIRLLNTKSNWTHRMKEINHITKERMTLRRKIIMKKILIENELLRMRNWEKLRDYWSNWDKLSRLIK